MKPTQEQVIAWAREAGIDVDTWMGVSKSALTEFFTIAYEAGRKDENEACQGICNRHRETIAGVIHHAIRARGQG